MTPLEYIDIHTHFPIYRPGTLAVENVYFGQSAAPSAAWRTVGLHPWYLDGVDVHAAEVWLRAEAALPRTVGLGECGLDKVCDTPWDVQTAAFQLCIRLALEFRLPLVIHCVRAYEEVISVLRAAMKTRIFPPVVASDAVPVIFHGFDKHPQTARMLLEAGCYLSFGAALLRSNSRSAEALQQTPAERYFLETDDKQVDIAAVYARAATLRGESEAVVCAQVLSNAARVFSKLTY